MIEERDPYVYPGTDVLRNKFGIRDADELRRKEDVAVTARMMELRLDPIKGNFDLEHLKAIHKYLFQDVYDWAGQIRTVGINKGGSEFARPEFIESFAKNVFKELAKDNCLRGLAPNVIENTAWVITELSAVSRTAVCGAGSRP